MVCAFTSTSTVIIARHMDRHYCWLCAITSLSVEGMPITELAYSLPVKGTPRLNTCDVDTSRLRRNMHISVAMV